MKSPKIKICGLTKPEEADFLNQVKVDYAGFVFFAKSKRNVTFTQAEEIQKVLSPDIKRVAVTVSPDVMLCQQIEEHGFDVLQVHGELKPEVLKQSKLPIWRACNIEKAEELKQLEHHEKITAYVVDAKTAGSGQTFDWQNSREVARKKEYYFHGKAFVLAGGLNSGNVVEGMELFAPDVLDVSSGVENDFGAGKDRELIIEFVKKVKKYSRGTPIAQT